MPRALFQFPFALWQRPWLMAIICKSIDNAARICHIAIVSVAVLRVMHRQHDSWTRFGPCNATIRSHPTRADVGAF